MHIGGGGGLGGMAAVSAEELSANTKAARVIALIDGSRQHVLHSRRAPDGRALKVVVFSQFRSVLNVVGDILLRRYGLSDVAEF